MTPYSLVADVGGTNTRVALANGKELLADSIVKHRNTDHASLAELLASYLQGQGKPTCDRAAVAIAGPVKDGAGRLTNLNWEIDKATLANVSGAGRSAVLNDLQAQGHALGHIADADLVTLKQGDDENPNAAMLVIGVGTGFNCAPVFQTAKGRFVPPSEAGHLTFAARGEEQWDLSQFLDAKLGHVAVEDVLSGRGLERCYAWASVKAGQNKTASTAEVFAAAQADDPTAIKAIGAFTAALGGVVGDLALTLLPFGGIYLVGGMSRAIAPWFDRCGFDAALTDKGRFSNFLNAFSIRLVEDDYAALSGCAHFLARSDNQ
ncbi:glucokinase [Aliiroseovarius sp. S1339]|uniref:glucokinase n=1 Tax=Aliiroseovarius sp. S1339 TaxID=2936990 RepID=UPI0020BD926E|nr:ROK family protein [Aliiroseovarius sp. S1339]MCK8463733.1 glucokinase [Aliiroseovarius sp. S1339]